MPRGKSSTDPAYEAFTRWWQQLPGGGLPTPEDVKRWMPRLKREGLLLSEDEYARRAHAKLLAGGDPKSGLEPYDLEAEVATAARRGIDITREPAFRELADLIELGRRLLRRKEPDPRKTDRARSARKEVRLRAAAKSSKKAHSKVLRTSSGRDPERDLEILKDIHGFLKVSLPVRLTAHRAHLVSPPTSSFPGPRTTTHDQTIWTPHWQKASLPIRAMAFGIAAAELEAVDFTLHLGDSGIAYGMGVGEMEFARRMYRKIWDAVQSECPKKGYEPPEFFFLVEQGVGERPHLHGVILLPRSRSHQRHLRELLAKAVGDDWKPSGQDNTQLEFGRFYEPAGWIEYIVKYTEQTKAELGDNIFACSRKLNQAGKEWYQRAQKGTDLLFPGRAVPVRLAALSS